MAARGYVFGVLGLAVFLAIAGVGYGVLVYPERTARAGISRTIATLPAGWTARYAGLKYSVLKRQLVLTDIVVSHDDTRVSVSQITLVGAESGSEPGAPLQFREASLLGVSVHTGAGDTTVRSIDAIELGGDFTAISQMFTKAEPVEAMFALSHFLHAKRVAISDIRQTLGPDTSSVARLVIDDLAHGVISRLAVDDLHYSAGGNSVVIAKSALAGTDVEALQAVFDPAAYTPGQKPSSDVRQFVRRLDMTSIDIGNTVRQLHIDAAQLAAFRGRPFMLAPTEANASDLRFEADVASALFLDSGTLRGVKIGVTPTGGAAAFRTFELNGYNGGKFSIAKLVGLDVSIAQPQQLKAALASLELRGTDFTRWLKLIAVTGPDAVARSNSTVELPYATAKDLQIGAASSVTPFRLASFASEAVYVDGQATNSKASIKGIEIPIDGVKMAPAQAAMFRGMQISRLIIDVEAASRWQPEEKRLLIDGLDVNLNGLGALGLTASIKGFNADGFTPDTMEKGVQGLRFEQLELHYHDASLVDRIFAMSAAQASARTDRFRASFIEQQEASAAKMQDTPEAAEALKQIIEFLRHPKTLVLTFAPAQPVGIADLQTTPPAQLPKVLGLHVAAE